MQEKPKKYLKANTKYKNSLSSEYSLTTFVFVFFLSPHFDTSIDEYSKHTSCITEAERYEKTVWKGAKKKRNPQQEWMDIVVHCSSNPPAHLRSYMTTMSELDNIPRNEKKFVNFASNSLHLRGNNTKVVEEIWNLLKQEQGKRIAAKEVIKKQEDLKQELKKQQQQEEKEKEVAVSDKEDDSDSSSSDDSDDKPTIDAKKVKKITKKTLKEAPNKSMKVKKLRKILGKELGLPKSAKKQLKKILLETAKASKNKIKVDGEIICLH